MNNRFGSSHREDATETNRLTPTGDSGSNLSRRTDGYERTKTSPAWQPPDYFWRPASDLTDKNAPSVPERPVFDISNQARRGDADGAVNREYAPQPRYDYRRGQTREQAEQKQAHPALNSWNALYMNIARNSEAAEESKIRTEPSHPKQPVKKGAKEEPDLVFYDFNEIAAQSKPTEEKKQPSAQPRQVKRDEQQSSGHVGAAQGYAQDIMTATAQGIVGPTGPKGDQGERGPTGPAGAKGEKGEPGQSAAFAGAYGGKVSFLPYELTLSGGYVTLPLPDATDSFARFDMSMPDSVVVSVSGVYMVDYEFAVRYANGVDILRLELCVNDEAVPNQFVERDLSALPTGERDTRPAAAREVLMRNKTFMRLNEGDEVYLRIYAPSPGTIITNDGHNAALTLLQLSS